MQADRVELRQQIDPPDPTVDAVRDRNVDDPILAGERYCRFRSLGRQGQEARPFATSQDDAGDVVHGFLIPCCERVVSATSMGTPKEQADPDRSRSSDHSISENASGAP
jgi:hypothetical protein